MARGDNLMAHLMKVVDLCLRLAAVGDLLGDNEKLVILLGSLSSDYDGMIKIIQTQKSVTLMEPKELLRREFKTLTKREQKEGASKANTSDGRGRKHRGKSRKW
ncbi:TPA: hypothetical protein N0F65_003017 [Lagenidium giganteum]|uniref:Polyprotein n=1 Tax=Lagenidium giganteum TaxID=4803 RepID=A0AAV2YTC9_9STRA|nr:TPA: hypothetical protein N0F65_003017 [Lagenidium giganteum]